MKTKKMEKIKTNEKRRKKNKKMKIKNRTKKVEEKLVWKISYSLGHSLIVKMKNSFLRLV